MASSIPGPSIPARNAKTPGRPGVFVLPNMAYGLAGTLSNPNSSRWVVAGGCSMADARELRSNAERCLRLAAQITDDKVAASLKALAAEYLDRVREVEGPPT